MFRFVYTAIMAAKKPPPAKIVQKSSALTKTTLLAAIGTSNWMMTSLNFVWAVLMLWWAVKRVHGCGDDGWIFSVLKGLLWVFLAELMTRVVALVVFLLMKVRTPADLKAKNNAILGVQIGAIVLQTFLIWLFSRCGY